MKVLRVIARLNVGGPARHVVLVDRGLRARGYETLLVHGSIGEGEASFEEAARRAAIPTAKIGELGRRISPASDARALARLVGLMFREKPDVVHTHTAKAGTVGRLAAAVYNSTRTRQRRAIVVHTFHGHVLDGYFGHAGNAAVRLTERVLARVTDCIVTISPSQRRDIVERYGIGRAQSTAIVPLGLELDSLLDLSPAAPDLRGELHIDRDAIVVGYIGRFVAIKDLETLIRSFAAVAGSHPNMVLIMVGDGPERGRMERLAADLGVTARVRFLGWRDDLPVIHATFDICALSSLNEGTPVALIEAMAAGRAVVATEVGGVPDVVVNDENGLLVNPGRIDEMAGALERLARCEADRVRLGSNARRSALRFRSERLVDDIDRLYRDTLAQRRR